MTLSLSECPFYLIFPKHVPNVLQGDKLEIMVLNVDGIRYIALTLLQCKSELACMELFALNVLVEKCSSFRSGTSLNFWQSLIYSAVIIISDGLAVVPFVPRLDNKRHCLHLALVVLVYPLHTSSHFLHTFKGIESKSSHPMVAALIDYAQTLSIGVKPERVEEFQNFRGEGVLGKIDGKEVYVGNQKIALRAAPSIGHYGEGSSVAYIFLGAAPVGIFSLSDSCRTGVREAINELKSMNIKTVMLTTSANIKTVMLTGDSHEAAIEAQKQVKMCIIQMARKAFTQGDPAILFCPGSRNSLLLV
ncbi:hypothetical protein RHMOL_Rhmol05G0022900 [Rhododendron molle]|uniref:Uncharacterized protein n=1 Tax=Rhododendron molle TaxID=49168 RepID=A0ACC0NM01_RHOML|nr:hypothetical protein RHMOL_Rhmol05G0022900 [Rhododendron molle]